MTFDRNDHGGPWHSHFCHAKRSSLILILWLNVPTMIHYWRTLKLDSASIGLVILQKLFRSSLRVSLVDVALIVVDYLPLQNASQVNHGGSSGMITIPPVPQWHVAVLSPMSIYLIPKGLTHHVVVLCFKSLRRLIHLGLAILALVN